MGMSLGFPLLGVPTFPKNTARLTEMSFKGKLMSDHCRARSSPWRIPEALDEPILFKVTAQ